MNTDLSRRNFLRMAGAAAALAAVPGWAQAATAERTLGKRKVKVSDGWDVIVIGGGPSGCTAAIAAAREGSRVLLIEAMGALGGLGTLGMVPAWCPFSDGEKIIYRGLAEKIFTAAREGVPHEGQRLDWVSINPEHLIRVYDKMVSESGAKVLFFSQVADVEMSANGTVDALIVANKNGLTAYKAKVYIDCTGDGDVAAWAGADYMKGDSDGKLQKSTLCYSVANVDSYAYQNGPNLHSGHNPNSPSAQAFKTGKYPLLDTHCCSNFIGPNVVQFNANHIEIADTTDPQALSDAMILGREIAEQHLAMLKEYRPETFGNAFIVKTAIIPGIRDSRRIVGDYTFTADDWYARRTFDDEIGRNCYFIDVHKSGHPEIHYGRGESHGIPYRCLTPAKLTNVLTAGRCISTDEEAYGSLRVMPPCLVTGEAAGIAAHMAAQHGRPDVHGVDTDDLRNRLRGYGQYFM